MTRGGTVTLSSVLGTAILAADFHLVAPLFFSSLGVILARTVFVQRENRGRKAPMRWIETLPLTGVGMLIAGAAVIEWDWPVPKAIFAGLASGWVAITLLDLLGERFIAVIRTVFGIEAPRGRGPVELPEPPPNELEKPPEDMLRLLGRVRRDDDEGNEV